MHSAIEVATAPGALWHLARQLRYRSTGTVAVMQCFHWAFKFASLMLGERQDINTDVPRTIAAALQIYERSFCDTELPRVGRGSLNLSSRFGQTRCPSPPLRQKRATITGREQAAMLLLRLANIGRRRVHAHS